MPGRLRPVWAEVDLGAIRHNAATLLDRARPAALCAVLKAWGYGHGPLRTAEAAIAGGATWLAVALVEEGADLRARQVTEPVLVLSEPPLEAMPEVVAQGLTPTLYTHAGIEAAAKAVAAAAQPPLPVHLKVDTGMHRVGAAPADIAALVDAVVARPELRLEGLWTHLAVADELDNPYTRQQLDRFEQVRARLRARGIEPPVVHAANSAGTIDHPEARYDLVRCGIALYGLAPSAALEGCVDLRPAMALKARVSYVKELPAGEALSYGLRYRLTRPSVVATVPIGYADGVPRRLGQTGGEVLIGGRRRPIAGSVTMDQITVDCGDDHTVSAGDEVVLIGQQGDARIGAEEWAARLDTIAYEVVCGIGRRVPRVYK